MTTTDTVANPKRDMARVRKAIAMADATMEHVATPQADALLAGLANADAEFRHTLAVNAGVNDPSETTWVAFLAVMADRVAATRK